MLPAAVAGYLADAHRRNGVTLHMNSAPAFEESPKGVDAILDGQRRSADLLVVAIGIHPNDHLARNTGIECRDGILTDANGVTSDPNIFAIGDVARQSHASVPEGIRIESWQNANDQADRAARMILGLEAPSSTAPRFWSDQYDMKIQIAGMPDPSAELISHEEGEHPLWVFETFAIGVNRPKDIHRFAMALADPVLAATTTDDKKEPVGATVRHRLGLCPPLADGELHKVLTEVVGDIVLVRQGTEHFALQDKCPHADASLSEGFLEGGRIACPLHFAEFDLVSGAVHGGPKGCSRAKAYRVEVEENGLYLHIPVQAEA